MVCIGVVTALAQSTGQDITEGEKKKMCGTDILASFFTFMCTSFDGEICGFLVIMRLLKTKKIGRSKVVRVGSQQR